MIVLKNRGKIVRVGKSTTFSAEGETVLLVVDFMGNQGPGGRLALTQG